MKKWMSLLLVAVMLVLAACGGGADEAVEATVAPAAPAAGSAQEAIATTLNVVAGDLYFDQQDNLNNPPTWTVKVGQPFEVDLKNEGALQHNWAIVKQGAEVPVPFDSTKNADLLLWDAGLVDPGQSEVAQFTPTEAGTYTVICTVAGHYPSMQGRLVVE